MLRFKAIHPLEITMLSSAMILVLFSILLPALTAPTTKPDVPVATEKENENKEFIFRVAKTVASKLSRDDPPSKIESLVNATATHLAKKMNASLEHVDEFKTNLLAAVVTIINNREVKYEQQADRSLHPGPKNVDQSKVVQALEELLEAPLISGFISPEQEKHMIRSGIEALSEDFGISKQTTEDIIATMIEHVQQDVKSFSKSTNKNNAGEPMSDKDKILGLEKMVEDKVTKDNLNLDEMKYLVKGLAAAVGSRNKLSNEKTKQLEERLQDGVYKFFAKSKIPEEKPLDALINNKDVPEGFRKAQESDKRTFEIEKKEKKDDDLYALLNDLEKKWDENKKSGAKKSSDESKKQKKYLKEILSNSLALMESLDEEKKQHPVTEKTTQADEEKEEKAARKHTETPTTAHTEPTKKVPTTEKHEEHKTIATPTKNHQDESHSTKEPIEKKNSLSHDDNEPIEKKSGISDEMERQIEEAEAEIQRDIEKQQREEEKKMMELDKEEDEKAKEKKKEKPKKQEKRLLSKADIDAGEEEIRKDLEKQKKELKQPKEAPVSKEEIDAAEKEIEKELEEQAKSLQLKSKLTTTTRHPRTTEQSRSDELVKQLDDLFQDS
ncbi:DNA ligase 1-like isoform X2 [Dendronephthya gigantea]|uniref:DNA ligase 1-like isoform X2 n=1 Tax=Dendronephthya gigantea TaxID=151771 RepID=UPI00106CF6AE|nr:DNA ligase 1-like isoform X2 [Dendronephthya gigantea]